jgi:hypothetical protein
VKAILLAAILAASSLGVLGKGSSEFTIKAGPKTISPQEAAITADPAAGRQHGVVLVEETERDDSMITTEEISYHMRAKILSAEGRALADIAIPFEQRDSDLKLWWGRTILPDGTVVELREDELKSQSVAKYGGTDFRELRGALPGVVPGCVIDFGYVLRNEGFPRSTQIVLQKQWPVRSIRYHWVPSPYRPAAYVTSRAEVQAKLDGRSVVVTAQDLEPVPEEPHMPPLYEARASVTLYYTTNEKVAEFWELGAKRTETRLKGFLRGTGAVKGALEEIGIPEQAPLPEKLKLAYDWLGAKIKNTMLKTAEEQEATDEGRDDETYSAKTVLKAGEGSPVQLDYLFAGMARALGAEAYVILAVDRTEQFWNKALKSFDQFSYTFVGVRAPGAPDADIVIVDPGSGLAYGQVPWRATGATALMCTPKGDVAILVPPSSPAINRDDTRATMAFSDDGESMVVKWSRTALGATGLGWRRWLRDLDARERKETLDDLCGASGTTEVTAAELPSLTEDDAPFQIACDLERSEVNASSEFSTYSLSLGGPWWPEVPEFNAATRVHPVIFDYPKVDILSMEVTAPHGFKPGPVPAPVKLDSQYGRYQLTVTATPTGYRVDRAFALTVLIAKVPEYDALKKYFDGVRKADGMTVTFVRDAAAK